MLKHLKGFGFFISLGFIWTLSFLDDEEESLQMQPTSERGRRRAMLDDGRPPSCGTSLGNNLMRIEF